MSSTSNIAAISQEEHVLAIPRQVLELTLTSKGSANALFQGYISTDEFPAILHLIKNKASHVFLPRSTAETDPSHKQLIPYVVIKQGEGYLSYSRSRAGGESRLHGRRSIGIGGHINQDDQSLAHGISRELQEEIILPKSHNPLVRLAGLINDDSNPVGQVHLGVVYILELQPGEPPQSADPAIQDLKFQTPSQLQDSSELYETWSKILIPHLW